MKLLIAWSRILLVLAIMSGQLQADPYLFKASDLARLDLHQRVAVGSQGWLYLRVSEDSASAMVHKDDPLIYLYRIADAVPLQSGPDGKTSQVPAERMGRDDLVAADDSRVFRYGSDGRTLKGQVQAFQRIMPDGGEAGSIEGRHGRQVRRLHPPYRCMGRFLQR